MKITDLQHLGLTEREARIYMAILEIGYSSVQAIARKAGTNRVAVYDVLEVLKNKNLVFTTYKGKRKVYVASKPEELLNILEEKKNSIQKEIQDYKDNLLPELISMYDKSEGKPRVKYYSIEEGLEIFRGDLIKQGDKYVYGINSLSNIPKKYFAPKAHIEYLNRKGTKHKTVCLYNENDKNQKDRKQYFPDVKFIPVSIEKKKLSCAIFANNNKVYIIHYKKDPFVLIIENESIYSAIKFLAITARKTY